MNSLSISNCLLILFFPLLIFIANGCQEEIVYPKGGYSYLKNINAKDSDFYFLPIRHTLSRRDSFWVTPSFKDVINAFDEQNLSINPPKEDIFRFIYNHVAIIILKKNKIVVKVPKSGSFVLAPDETKLNSLEKMHFNLTFGNYPLEEEVYSVQRKILVDSLIKIYPELLDPVYHRKLIDKVFSKYQGPFEYSTKEIKITYDKYKYLVDLINDSEFWQRPYHLKGHEEAFADGYVFFLEAVTKNKYHCVRSNMYFDGPSKFRKACDELIKCTGIANEISWTTYEEFLNRPVQKIEVKELELEELKEEPAPKPKKSTPH